jgi:hypothetical protein
MSDIDVKHIPFGGVRKHVILSFEIPKGAVLLVLDDSKAASRKES